jgi:hypothetical protein
MWPNRDPIAESGFEALRLRSSGALRAIAMLERVGGNNLFEFVNNQPTDGYDALGLAPATGPDSVACEQAEAKAAAAVATWRNDPSDPNRAAAMAAIQDAAQKCKPPPPPPTPPVFCPVWPGNPTVPLHLPPTFWPTVGIGIGIAVGCTLCPECCIIVVVAG